MREIRKKIAKVIIWPIGFIAIFLWFHIFLATLPTYNPFFVIGGSMVPAINHGAFGVTKVPKNIEEIKIGDIVTYNIDCINIRIIHRVTEINVEENAIITKGDANYYPDPWIVRFECIRGIYLFSIPYIGYILIMKMKVHIFLFSLF